MFCFSIKKIFSLKTDLSIFHIFIQFVKVGLIVGCFKLQSFFLFKVHSVPRPRFTI